MGRWPDLTESFDLGWTNLWAVGPILTEAFDLVWANGRAVGPISIFGQLNSHFWHSSDDRTCMLNGPKGQPFT